MQRRLAAGALERAGLAIDRANALCSLGKARHEALKTGAELVGSEPTQDPAERVVTGRAMFQVQETAQELLLVLGKLGHRGLPATQHGAQRNHQDLQPLVAPSIARARIFQTFKAGPEPFHPSFSTHRIEQAMGKIESAQTRKPKYRRQDISNAIPLVVATVPLPAISATPAVMSDNRACRVVVQH